MRPAGPAPKVQIVPVWRLLRYVKTRLREDPKLQYLGVSGEVSNLKRQPNGTLYFDLKDADGLLNCVAWAEAALALPPVENGDAIVALGAVTVYEKQSRVQLDVRAVQSRNRPGDLHRKYEELRRKLQAEGLFAQDRKRRLPRFPFRIALVSSRGAQGAGDFQTIVANRAPHVEVVVCETAVQGFGANLEIARAIDKASKLDVDCIVVARGGGSFEDLFPFSQEEVVRAIVRASKPVVAAIGHEGDTPLADLVADERAPTPSAAAHRLVPERAALLAQLAGMRARSAQAALRVVARAESDAQKAVRYSALADPMRFFGERRREIERLRGETEQLVRRTLDARAQRVRGLERRLARFDPSAQLAERAQGLELLRYRLGESARAGPERAQQRAARARERLARAIATPLERAAARVALAGARLDGTNPETILQRGYAIVRHEGRVVRDAAAVPAGARIDAKVARGTLVARVEAVQPDGGD